ncbi:MAG: CinA family protein [Patescibacteria group bacterium]|nr:CinA family protein [Patescibacteria group bacterium]
MTKCGATRWDSIAECAGGARVIRHRAIKCFGVGESQVEAMLPDLIRRGREPLVGINASQATIILRISAEGTTAEEADSRMIPTVETIHSCLGNVVFGEEDDELQDAVLRRLTERCSTLAVVELATEGLVAEWLAQARDSRPFVGGLVARSLESAARALGGSGEVRAQAASGEEVERMASQCRNHFDADYALAVGPVSSSRPSSGEPAVVCFALAGPEGVVVHRHPYAGHPAIRRVLCGKAALNFVRLVLLDVVQD